MELPAAPQDIELRNIIDKLAQFVARNGPEFEQMTKNKQKGNPKFGFLFGGEYFNYYQYKVTTEQAILKVKENRDVGNTTLNSNPVLNPSTNSNATAISALLMNAVQGIATQNNVQGVISNVTNQGAAAVNLLSQWLVQAAPLQPTLESIAREQAALQEQTHQSQQNLNAQHLVLIQQQEAQVEEAIRKAESDKLTREADELGINLTDLDNVLQPITDTCTKDSISNGKAWILQRATSKSVNDLLARYLLHKVLEPDKTFNHKLHIIYLVNDILHHCVRKHTEEFKIALEQVVVPMFCNASLGVNEEQQAKLNKLLTIWETKNHYFSDEIVSQLHDPVVSWSRYKSDRGADHREIIDRLTADTKAAFLNFQSQHLAFVSHTMRQIQTLEQQKQQLEAMQKQQQQLQQQQQMQQQQQLQQTPLPPQQPAPLFAQANQPPPPDLIPPTQVPSSANEPAPPPPDVWQAAPEPPGTQEPHYPPGTGPPNTHPDLGINMSLPPPGYLFQPPPPTIELPDLTRPPPGFAPVQPEIQPEDLLPSLPYFDLPAGLMVPLIKLEDYKYKPLDPDAIRLPPPAPPSERLLAAVKAFYTPPGHDQPRDSDGWEKLGLYEYFRAKISARKQKEKDIEDGLRELSRSPSPVKSWQEVTRSPPPKRRYSSRSRSRSRERTGKQRRRRERSPQQQRQDSNSSPPPQFMGIGYRSEPDERTEERLTEGNKGHQMLKKMGWSGAGLGVKEQGIETPIQGGDIRDRSDQYKGVGVNLNDPYENFRKSKGQAFITRMKARAEERS
ncbi:calcium homeostasis endoplasmic reticulum protein isoform X1 [Halyomorpha halys]|uniref:calcium homeostasis endoplasmic reticulum protein isoform X1 n=1 Tax=Halyomorpha halys TaxID=286706 RepID=UPI0006D4CDA3